MLLLKDKWLARLFLLAAYTIDYSIQQDDGSDDTPDDGSDGTDDGSGDGSNDGTDDDECSLISGHSCNPNGICKYCAMCIQSSCILTKSSMPTATCNATQLGTPDVYDWYNYCLSSGNDSGGDYCATSLECYQYRKNSNSSVSHVWQNLTCDVSSCVLVTSSGQPAPAPGALPPDSSSSSSAGGGGHHRHHDDGSEDRSDHPHTTTIALTATCSFIFLIGIIWITRLWLQRARRGGFWGGFLPWSKKRRVPSSVASSETPSTAPPSFRSREMQQQTNNNVAVRAASSSVHSSSSRSTRSRIGEPLPSYFSPDPPPPKYEQAIVTQIRGLREHGILDDDSDHSSNGNNANSSSSSSNQANPGDASADGHGALPPPLWLPVYFTPNHSAFSFGRLRRHPPNGASSVASSSHDPSPMWHHNNDWADPLRAFWYHHQQQIQQQHPQPQMQQLSSPSSSAQQSQEQQHQQQQEEQQAPQPQPSNSSPPAVRRRRSADLAHILDRDAH